MKQRDKEQQLLQSQSWKKNMRSNRKKPKMFQKYDFINIIFTHYYIIFFFLDLNVLDECEGPRNMGKLEESYVLLKKSDSSNQDMVRIDR